MIFTVVWDPDAENELTILWIGSPTQQAIADAADYIDRELRDDPLMKGTSYQDPRRILFAPPLGIIFEVSEPDRIVRVLAVWHVPTDGAP